MRGHQNTVYLGKSGDPTHLGDSSAVADVRLQNIHQLPGNQFSESPPVEEPLPRCQLCMQTGLPHQFKTIRIVRRHRFLEKEKVELLYRPDLLDGQSRPGTAVIVHHDIHIRSQGFTQLRDMVPEKPGDFTLVYVVIRVPGPGFHSGISVIHPLFRHLDTARPCIGPNAFTDGPPQKLIYRHSQYFPLDVPEGLVYSAQCRIDDDPSAISVVQKHDLPVMFDVCGILAYNILRYKRHRPGDGRRLVDQGPFSPAVHSLVGFDFDENPVSSRSLAPQRRGKTLQVDVSPPHDIRLDLRDLHSFLPDC